MKSILTNQQQNQVKKICAGYSRNWFLAGNLELVNKLMPKIKEICNS